jgi:PAS domain S-box-containing protein
MSRSEAYALLSEKMAPPSTVLVVDDDDAARYATVRILKSAGFDTLETAGGAEALELARDAAAVVLDVHLPDVHGLEVCRLLRADDATATIPVIHVSGVYVAVEDRVAGINTGADAYMLSPVEPPVLVATLQALIRARNAAREARLGELRFRGIFEQSASAIALVDDNGCLAEVNPAFARLVGRAPGELRGTALADLASEDAQRMVRQTIRQWASEPWQGHFSLLRGRGRITLDWWVSRHVEPGFSVAVASESRRGNS